MAESSKSSKGSTAGLLIVGGGVLAAAIFFGRKYISKLMNLEIESKLISVDKSQSTSEYTVIRLIMDVYNPNKEDIRFKTFSGNIYSDGKRIANIDRYKEEKLIFKGRENTAMRLKVKLPNAKLGVFFLESLSNLLGGKTKKIPIKLIGKLEVEDLAPLPVDKDLSIDLMGA